MKLTETPNQKKSFSGGEHSLKSHLRIYKNMGLDFHVVTYGSSTEIHINGKIKRFNCSKHTDKRIGACCRAVIHDVTKYTKENGVIKVEKRATSYRNAGKLTDMILKGRYNISLIDFNACYWNLIHGAGIITDKTHAKYLDEKKLRVIAVGNLMKKKIIETYDGGKKVNKDEFDLIENPNAWVWDYAVFKAYEVFRWVNNYIDGRVLAFQTDCFFVDTEDEQAVVRYLKAVGRGFSVDRWTIVGRTDRAIVLSKSDGTEIKRSMMGLTGALKLKLPLLELESDEDHKIIRVIHKNTGVVVVEIESDDEKETEG